MTIEINEMVVQMRVDEMDETGPGLNTEQLARELKALQGQMLSQCRDLFNELLAEQKER
jgi:hypothetical protein